MQKFPMTQFGAKQLEEELSRLKSTERTAVIQAIAEARSHGDISENAEYDAAKERQAFIEARIAEIEAKLSRAEIITQSSIHSDGKIVFGAIIKLLDMENDGEVVYQIVGDDEADIKQKKISVNTPVARSLIGKRSGDIVEVKVPNGIKEYEILQIEFD